MLEKFPEEYDLLAKCGIAKTGGFKANTSIREAIEEVLQVSEAIFATQLLPAIDEPITNFILDEEAR